jgi:site-specific DNA-methyltransferase (adenine-specific)
MSEYEIVDKKIKIDDKKSVTIKLINDHFENAKRYNIPHAQLIIADIPYNLGNNAYASNPSWYIGGDNKNGESKLAGKSFFDTDNDFKINNFFDFCTRYMNKEPKKAGERGRSSDAPAMIVFCAFEQIPFAIEQAKKHGLAHSYPLVFIKNYSSQVLKANMKIVGATEYAVVFYRDKLPKFRNIDATGKNRMIFNWFEWRRDNSNEYPKIHPTQKPVNLLKQLIEVFTDEGDVVIDPCAGSGSTLRACAELKRSCYGFEIKKDFCKQSAEKMLNTIDNQMSIFDINS